MYAIDNQKRTTTAAARDMRARSLNYQNCFKLSENKESVLKSAQNREQIFKISESVFLPKNQHPGGYQKNWDKFFWDFLKKLKNFSYATSMPICSMISSSK